VTLPTPPAPADPYADLAAFQALPRLVGLALSPDGGRLVTTVSTLDAKGVRRVSALWEVDPRGERPARRLTRSAKGEGDPVFAADGSVLFTSARPDPDAADGDGEEDVRALWRLPACGEAQVAGSRPGGVAGLAVARQAPVVAVFSDTLPGAEDGESDAARRKARKDAGVDAMLHGAYPVRHWDADLGAGHQRLLVGRLDDEAPVVWRDLTPSPGRALDNGQADLTPDGATVVTTWWVAEPHGSRRTTLVAVDVATGERRTLLDDGSSDVSEPVVSPDGAAVAVLVETRSTPDQPVDAYLAVVPLDGSGEVRRLAPGWDRWPTSAVWSPDGTALLVTADEGGAAPVSRLDVASGEVVRLTGDRGHYSDLCVSPDGRHVHALRDAVDAAPAPVRLDAAAPDQQPVALRGPVTAPAPPGRLEEVTATAEDGSPLRAWLALPDDDGPHPLLLWVHGGPLGSWNGWSWRWNPHLMTGRGYAVLLPDPALSTGYGRAFVERGWGRWGAEPFTDLMALTDAAEARPDVDAGRTAAMGGSFGGYMANWIATHTDRFRAVVTHASLWDLEQFAPTTDVAYYWSREMTAEMSREHSPSRYADAITSPVLVVHGDKDYRVPVGEALRLWWDLCARAEDPAAMPHRFLYFPRENHWILSPGHARVWYEAVLAFLATHVLGEPETVPDLLR
jgi:dipeptidyl aminopeptidase/acylaminoacyl peptidase